jgi:uracil phosphoribosyltransferase
MQIIDFSSQNSAIGHCLSQLRDVNLQNDRLKFRNNIRRISIFMAYEISKQLSYAERSVQTPLTITKGTGLAEPPVLAFVLRAGLAMHSGFLEVFDEADHCFISAYREEGNPNAMKVHVDYLASPVLENKTVILVDPMLATGSSLVLGYQAMLKRGKPKELHIACLVAAPQGVEVVRRNIPAKALWLASLDEGLNEKAYIVPGLGDAGDLAFGEKL